MRSLLRYVIGRFGRPISDYARDLDPYLRSVLENLFLPEVPVYFVSMLLAMLADGDLGLIEGGCRDFVGALENRYAELGGKSTFRATVKEIMVEGDRAVGVRLADGTEHRSDVVVSAADGRSTVFGLLDGRYVSNKIRRRYATWKLLRPMAMISYGVAREFLGEPVMSTIRLERPFDAGGEAVEGFMVRLFNYGSSFAPAGKTVVQVEFETGFDHWNELQAENREKYDAEKEEVAAQVLDRLEGHYPGIGSRVEMTDVATPYTTWRYTLNHRASYLGWLMTPESIRTPIERTLPGLDAFYMAGQWVMPGGGVPACLYSGRDAIQLICRDEGKRFVTAGSG
jgi:phytoene dehydrogenase-like protein